MKACIPTRQHGQALAEFLIVALALIPLFLLVPMIAKYQDIRSAAQMASRYAAFDAMTYNDSVGRWKPEVQLANELRRRFFSNPAAPIKTGDVAGDFKSDQDPFWRDPRDAPLIRSVGDDIRVSFGDAASAKHQQGFKSGADDEPFLQRSPLSLKARGIYTAGVSVTIAKLPAGVSAYEPFDVLDLKITQRTSVLIDHWSGRDPISVQSHLGSPIINAGTLLEPFAPVVDVAVPVHELPPFGKVRPPRLGDLTFWKDVVPPDRLY